MVRKVNSVENEDEEDCALVPTFQSAFTEALGAAGWTRNAVNPEGQGEVLETHARFNLANRSSLDVKDVLEMCSVVLSIPCSFVL